jgi:hypothetical protein
MADKHEEMRKGEEHVTRALENEASVDSEDSPERDKARMDRAHGEQEMAHARHSKDEK